MYFLFTTSRIKTCILPSQYIYIHYVFLYSSQPGLYHHCFLFASLNFLVSLLTNNTHEILTVNIIRSYTYTQYQSNPHILARPKLLNHIKLDLSTITHLQFTVTLVIRIRIEYFSTSIEYRCGSSYNLLLLRHSK